jgi:hypothetical protein
MDQQRHKPVLVELWDVTQPVSMRTMPYLQRWHELYSDQGLRVVGIHTPCREESKDEDALGAAIERLGITYPVMSDPEGDAWEFYGAQGYPSRYLFNGDFRLEDVHVGEGAYEDTELLIQQLLGIEQATVPPFRPTDSDDAEFVVPSADREGNGSGPYSAGSVWVSAAGTGTVAVNGTDFPVNGPVAFEAIANESHTDGEVVIEAEDGVTILATCFAPGQPA